MRLDRVPLTITITPLAALFLFTSLCHAQFVPPPAGAYTMSGGNWIPAASTATGAVNFTPPPVALYCYNSGLGKWVPADSSCFGGGGGGGTVTSVSSGNLSPLFSTSVATPTTTPALSFSLSTASADTVFGNCTTGSATPSYCTITAAMLPGGTVSGLTTGFVPKAASATSLANSAIDDGITTAGFITSTEPININDSSHANFVGFTPNGVAAAVQSGMAGWGLASTLTTAGIYLMPDSPASGIWRGANSGGVVTDTISEISGDCTTSGSNAITCTKTSGTAFTTAATTAIGTSGATIPLNNGANTESGAYTFSAAGAASSPGVSVTGAGFAGTGTTSTPQLYINQGATAPTTWSTGAGGTMFGGNAPSGFAGNFMDFHINGGASLWYLSAAGNVFHNGNYYFASLVSPTPYISGVSNFIGFSTAGLLGWSNGSSGGGTRDLTECREAAGILEIGASVNCANSGTVDAATIKTSALTQQAASNTGGTCAMSSGTSCTITIGHTYTTPVCIATQQSATLTGGAVGCTISGTTVTITSAVANSETWGALVFGNPI